MFFGNAQTTETVLPESGLRSLREGINFADVYAPFSTEPEIPVAPGRRVPGKGDHFRQRYNTAE